MHEIKTYSACCGDVELTKRQYLHHSTTDSTPRTTTTTTATIVVTATTTTTTKAKTTTINSSPTATTITTCAAATTNKSKGIKVIILGNNYNCIEINRNILCPLRLPRGRISNASRLFDGTKSKILSCVEGDVEKKSAVCILQLVLLLLLQLLLLHKLRV